MDLRQGRAVADYHRKFIAHAAPLEEVSEVCLLSKFVSGLRLDIRRELRLLRPVGLDQAMELAQLVEEKLSPSLIKARANGVVGGGPPFSKPKSVEEISSSPRATILSKDPTTTTRAEFRRLSNGEIQQCREKGLCYRYNEKFSPGHRCKREELSILVVQEDQDNKNEMEEELARAEDSQMA